jgi:hypothetical protein
MEKITLSKECFSKRGIFQESIAEIEVPELNALMGLGKDQVATVKIQQLDLNSFLKSRTEIIDYTRNLVEGIVEASAEKEMVKTEIIEIWKKMTPDTKYKIEIVESSLIEPKLNRSDIVFLSKMFPLLLLKIYNKAIELTNKGGNLKKNS